MYAKKHFYIITRHALKVKKNISTKNDKNIYPKITNERTSIKDVEERFIATVACKAAVKANMDLSKQEVENLIQSLLSLNNPYTCPHGRPTTIKISRDFIKNKLLN